MRPAYICIGNIAVPHPSFNNNTLHDVLSSTSLSSEWSNTVTSQSPFDVTSVSQANLQRNGGNQLGFIISYSIVFLLATVGNSFVIATLVLNKRMGTVTNYFLLSLAVSDLLVALICIPLTLIGRIKEEFIFGQAMCKIMPYLMGVSVTVSTFTMLAISLERYYAICKPFHARGWQTKSHACKVIFGIWTVSFLLMVPVAVFQTIVLRPIAKLGICKSACRIKFPDHERADGGVHLTPASAKAWYMFQLITLLIIPGIVMTVAYGCVCKTIYNGFRFQVTKQSQQPAGGCEGSCGSTPASERKSGIRDRDNTSSSLLSNNEKYTSKSSSYPVSNGKNELVRNSPKLKSPKYGAHNDLSRRNDTRKQLEAKKKIVEMLIVIVLLFFICWTPTFVVNVWKSFEPQRARKQLERGIAVIQILPYVSTCVNPVVYCFLNNRFRQAFLNIFCICCGCLPEKCQPKSNEAKRQPTATTNHTVVSSTTNM